ncbi:MAG: alpha/beta hydrolase [Bacteroidales bacterium]|nr:alpha/beta hydrolase [Bacteroidales bacterium]
MKKIHARIGRLILFLMVFGLLFGLTSCHRLGMEDFTVGKCFAGTYNGRDIAVRIDEVARKELRCSLYFADTPVSMPKPIVVSMHSAKKWVVKNLERGDSKRFKVSFAKNKITCEEPQSNDIAYVSPVDMSAADYKPLYSSKSFEVKCTKDVRYAVAQGYWAGYPDEDKPFAQIYLERMGQLVEKQDVELCMDVYEPVAKDAADSSRLRPLIMLIHGGSFYNGDKSDEPYRLWCSHFASLGYVAVSINYRMGWTPTSASIDIAGYRAAQDAHAAVRFLLHNAEKYHINPEQLFIGGSSAGAITALNVAFLRENDRPESVKGEGPINKVAPEYDESFQIAAVINMWGAVCDTSILQNSVTSILSFHGDADDIIPYDYGYPFRAMFANMIAGKADQLIEGLFSGIENATNFSGSLPRISLPRINPRGQSSFWDGLVSPMYGSYCIDQYYKNNGFTNVGFRSELHTKPNAGHSLHVDEHRNLSSYFDTITNVSTTFLYEELVKKPVCLQQIDETHFSMDNSNVAESYWWVEGGAVLASDAHSARVVFFGDAPVHKVIVAGVYRNGIEFREELVLTAQ